MRGLLMAWSRLVHRLIVVPGLRYEVELFRREFLFIAVLLPPSSSSGVRPGFRPGAFFSAMVAGSPAAVSINERV